MTRKLDAENLGIILLNAFMEEFFPEEKQSTPDTFTLFHYNGQPRSCPDGRVRLRTTEPMSLAASKISMFVHALQSLVLLLVVFRHSLLSKKKYTFKRRLSISAVT